jgi:hypothetical protein
MTPVGAARPGYRSSPDDAARANGGSGICGAQDSAPGTDACLAHGYGAATRLCCYLAAFFYRKAGKHGIRKAIVATAHRLLVIAFCILRERTEYREIGGDYFDQLHPERTRNRLVRRLERLGYEVILQPRAIAAISSPGDMPPPRRRRGRPCLCAQRQIPCIHNGFRN